MLVLCFRFFAFLSAFLSLVQASPSDAQFDYTPGFDPGPQSEMRALDGLIGAWDIQLFFPARDESAADGWAWREWAQSNSVIEPRLGGVTLMEQNLGFPISAQSVGAEGFDHWSYDTHITYDLVAATYRLIIIDNIWGLADIYEGEFDDSGADFSNLNTGSHTLMGRNGDIQKALIRITDLEQDSFVVEWWTVDGADIVEGGIDAQPWMPSVRMEYTRRN